MSSDLKQPFLAEPAPDVKSGSSGGSGQGDAPREIVIGPAQRRSMRDASGSVPRQSVFPDNTVRTARYTWFDFIPRSFFGQFRRLANQYFLFQTVVMIIGEHTNLYSTPLKAWPMISVLVFVVGLQMLFELRDEVFRHKKDREVNATPARRVGYQVSGQGQEESQQTTERWRDILVGDVLVVRREQSVPADIVLLSTSEENGLCYIETSNIDGETNLKLRNAVLSTDSAADLDAEIQRLAAMDLNIKVGTPNKSINDFNGALRRAGEGGPAQPLGEREFVIRGSKIKNTRWAIGVVVYTGPHTKIMMNSTETPHKMSNIDKIINRILYVIILTQCLLVTFADIASIIWRTRNVTQQGSTGEYSTWYLVERGDSISTFTFPPWLAYWFSYFILFNNFLPINLYVIMDFVNLLQSLLISSDMEMYDEETDSPATCRSTNLCQELGQVQYIFSDKTGTLTQNLMVFREFSIGGSAPYGEAGADGGVAKPVERAVAEAKGKPERTRLDDFLVALTVAHTVVVDEEGELQAESPDEAALIEGAGRAGYRLSSRGGDGVKVSVDGEAAPRAYRVLAVNTFSSKRKRMSVVVALPDGSLRLIMKGADNMVYDRLSATSDDQQRALRDSVARHLEGFAVKGLRTLAVAQRSIDSKSFESWKRSYDEAAAAVEGRKAKLEAVADEIERDLTLVGATGIEDKLQESVAGTITDLQAAGIKFWVLTGDKLETAINIGYSSGVLKRESTIHRLRANSRQQAVNGLAKVMREIGDHARGSIEGINRRKSVDKKGGAGNGEGKSLGNGGKSAPATMHRALVVTGPTLEYILDDDELRYIFLDVCQDCSVVVACRVSPLQKAKLVRMVRRGVSPEPITLAIGDGANDVGMIQEAHIGIGVSGKEGRQAVNSSDFSIAQFRFLKRLLLVHGRWNYRRMCKVITYIFYKNFTITLTLLIYSFMAGISGTSLYESLMYNGFNFFTMFPIVAVGCLDQDVRAETVERFPVLYVSGRLSLDLNTKIIIEHILIAILHAIIIVFFPYLSYSGLDQAGVGGLYVFGTIVFSCLIFLMQYRAMLITTTFTRYTWYSLGLSFFLFYLFLVCYGVLKNLSFDFYWVPYKMMEAPVYWILLFGVPATALFVDFCILWTRREFFPKLMDVAMEADHVMHGQSREGHKSVIQKLAETFRFRAHARDREIRDQQQQMHKEQRSQNASSRASFHAPPGAIPEEGEDATADGAAVQPSAASEEARAAPAVGARAQAIAGGQSEGSSSAAIGFSFSHPGETVPSTLRQLTAGEDVDAKKVGPRAITPTPEGKGTPKKLSNSFDIEEARPKGYKGSDKDGLYQQLDEDAAVGKPNRPSSHEFLQQSMKRWQEPLSPRIVITTLMAIAVGFIVLGSIVVSAGNESKPVVVTYAGQLDTYTGQMPADTGSGLDCSLPQYWNGTERTCTLNFRVPHDLKAPVYVSYMLGNFYQNYQTYKVDRSATQLMGEDLSPVGCHSYATNSFGQTYYPCGLTALSVFNDTFTVLNASYEIDRSGIAWKRDNDKYKNIGSYPKVCGNDAVCLNQSVPDIPNILSEGVTNEDFMVWNRIAALPRFTKQWGRIDRDIDAGSVLSVRVRSRFPVQAFRGSKSLVLSSNSWLGGENAFLGWAYIAMGALCVATAILLLAKQAICPRKTGSAQLLEQIESISVADAVPSVFR